MNDYDYVLNGYARIIKFEIGEFPPKHDSNTFISMYEGQIKDGVPHGLGREFTYEGQDVKVGYFEYGRP